MLGRKQRRLHAANELFHGAIEAGFSDAAAEITRYNDERLNAILAAGADADSAVRHMSSTWLEQLASLYVKVSVTACQRVREVCGVTVSVEQIQMAQVAAADFVDVPVDVFSRFTEEFIQSDEYRTFEYEIVLGGVTRQTQKSFGR